MKGSTFAQTPSPITLRNCFEKALEVSERVAIQESQIRAAEAKYGQALAAILPNVHFIATEFLQDDSAQQLGAGQIGTTLTRFSTPTAKLNAKQPLFNGLREYYALSVVHSQKRQNKAEWENAKRKLFVDVANAFYTVIQLEKDLELAKAITKTLKRRLKESITRMDLGKARASEKMNTESELAIAEAAASETEGGLAAAKEVLAFFIGPYNAPLLDDVEIPSAPKEEDFVLKSDENRPDIVAAKEAAFSSRQKLKIEKGAFFPTINAEANYYAYRVGFQKDIKWDALFTLDFSIFEGGKTRAKIQEAKILLKQAELELDEKRRNANLEIKKAYEAFTHGQKQSEAFKIAETKGEENYRVSLKDYQLGLINNLELLEVLRSLQNVRRTYNRVWLQTKMDYLNLKAKAGKPLL